MNSKWQVGKKYLTKGRLKVLITNIKKRPIPKGLSPREKSNLLERPFFGVEGYLVLDKYPNRRIRGEWTLSGQHTVGASRIDLGDLTEEEVK